jgi:hypothetical protein
MCTAKIDDRGCGLRIHFISYFHIGPVQPYTYIIRVFTIHYPREEVGSRQNDFSDSGRESNCSTTRVGHEAHNQALQAMLNRQAEIKVTHFRFPVRFSDHSQKSIRVGLWPTSIIEKVFPFNTPPPPCTLPLY